MLPTKGHKRPNHGFTLVEVMVTTGISAIVMIGLLSAYTYVGHNSYRLGKLAEFEEKSRRALVLFNRDIRLTQSLEKALSEYKDPSDQVTHSEIELRQIDATMVEYRWNDFDRILYRDHYDEDDGLISSDPLLSALEANAETGIIAPKIAISSVSFKFYNKYGNDLTDTPDVLSIKQLHIMFTGILIKGDNPGSDLTRTVVSANQVLAGSKALLGEDEE